MKQLIIAAGMLLLSAGAHAQTDTTRSYGNKWKNKTHRESHRGHHGDSTHMNQARANGQWTNPSANRNANPGDKEVKVKEKPGKTKIKHNKGKMQHARTDSTTAGNM